MAKKRRRNRKSLRKRQEKKNILGIILKVVPVIVIFIGISYWLLTRNMLWDKKSRINLVTGDKEQVKIMSFDPVSNEITILSVPGNTQLEVSRQLGVWKIKSLWELGKGEEIGGRLMAESVTKNFNIPVYVWLSPDGHELVSTGVGSITHVLKGYDTNLSLMDRINLALFSLRVKNFERKEIELEETRVLGSTTLKDGSHGYVLESSVPPSILSSFTDRTLSEVRPRIVIRDYGSGNVISNKVAKIIEGMGGKVTSVAKEEEQNLDCEVVTVQVELGKLLSSIFLCDLVKENPSSNFDIEIKLGEEFKQRF